MKSLRKSIFGYQSGAVNRYVREYKRKCENDLTDLNEEIGTAEKFRAELQDQLAALQPFPSSEAVILAESETAATAALEEIVELVEIPVERVEEPAKQTEIPVEWSEVLVETVAEPIVEEIAEETSSNIIQFKRRTDIPVIVQSTFWGDLSKYLESPAIEEEIEETLVEMQAAHPQMNGTFTQSSHPRFFNYSLAETSKPRIPATWPIKERRGKEKVASLTQRNPEPPAQSEPKVLSNPSASVQASESVKRPSESSRAISNEVRQLRYKYIVGKRAGEDLFDQQGAMIIAQNQLITEGVVDQAEQAGKLAQLIIQMTLPGLEDEL